MDTYVNPAKLVKILFRIDKNGAYVRFTCLNKSTFKSVSEKNSPNLKYSPIIGVDENNFRP